MVLIVFETQFPILFLGETKIPDDKRAALVEAFGFLNTFLEGSEWLAGGAEPSLADIFAAASLSSVIVSIWDIDYTRQHNLCEPYAIIHFLNNDLFENVSEKMSREVILSYFYASVEFYIL